MTQALTEPTYESTACACGAKWFQITVPPPDDPSGRYEWRCTNGHVWERWGVKRD